MKLNDFTIIKLNDDQIFTVTFNPNTVAGYGELSLNIISIKTDLV